MKMREQAFTLVEVITVVGIIAILAGLTIGGLSMFTGRAADENTKALLIQVEDALEKYYSEFGHYPPDGYDGVVTTNAKLTGEQSVRIKGSQCLVYFLCWRYGPKGANKFTLSRTKRGIEGSGNIQVPANHGSAFLKLEDKYFSEDEYPYLIDITRHAIRYDNRAGGLSYKASGEAPDPRRARKGRSLNAENTYDAWSVGKDPEDAADDLEIGGLK